jgi:hypothetical protein
VNTRRGEKIIPMTYVMRIENRDKRKTKRHASLIRSINNKNIKHLEYMQKEYEIKKKVNVQFYTLKSKQQERNIMIITCSHSVLSLFLKLWSDPDRQNLKNNA